MIEIGTCIYIYIIIDICYAVYIYIEFLVGRSMISNPIEMPIEMKEDRYEIKSEKTLFNTIQESILNEFKGYSIIEIGKWTKRGDMAKLVDATDLIGLSLGMETYQVITFKFRETLELKMGNPEPNPVLWKQTKVSESENK